MSEMAGNYPEERPSRDSILSRMDQDVDRIFTSLDALRGSLEPVLMESHPSSEVAMAGDPPRNQLESLAYRLPVIAGQLNDLVKRVAL